MTISPTLDAPSSWYKRRSIHTNYCRLEAMPTLASSSHLLAILAVALLVTSGDPVSAGYIGSPPRSRPTAAFIFGDSLVDTGTNNRLPSTISKADHHPYGIDFPGGQPTGRYCNGRLVSDFAVEYWGVKHPLPYNDPGNTGETMLLGANFASGGAGILNDTGRVFIQRYRMSDQVSQMGEYADALKMMVGDAEATRILNGAFYSINIGSNDLLSNYLLPFSPRKRQFTFPEFLDLLMSVLNQQAKTLYSYGARKLVFAGMGPIGCMPLNIGERFLIDLTGACIESFQQMAIAFNDHLKSMLADLQQELPDSTIFYSNAYDIAMDIIQNPSEFGFTNVNTACCGRGTKYRSLLGCQPSFKICEDRDSYVFWDPFHPSEAVNRIITNRVFFGPTSDISPMNLSQLVF